MTSKAGLAAAVAAGALGGFLAGRLGSSPEPANDGNVAAELRRLSAKVEHLEESLRAMRAPQQPSAAQAHPPSSDAPPRRAAPEPSADTYASWTDEETCLVALRK